MANKVLVYKKKDGIENILPALGKLEDKTVTEHNAEPIKDPDLLIRISEYLIKKGRYRDNMLFITGINFGLRVSDLVQLRFCDLIDEKTKQFKESFPVFEIKTRNTRKKKKNRYITINRAVKDSVVLYLDNNPSRLDEYMFRSESNRGCGLNQPISRASVDRILKGIASDMGITTRVSTHTLRKTFGYHQMQMAGNDPRKLLLLQKMFGHSSVAQTLDYIGITEEEISKAYLDLNLGSKYVRQYDRYKGVIDSYE